MILETDDDRAMPVDATAPAVVSVVFVDLARSDQFQIAVGAYIVVSVVALRTVKASR